MFMFVCSRSLCFLCTECTIYCIYDDFFIFLFFLDFRFLFFTCLFTFFFKKAIACSKYRVQYWKHVLNNTVYPELNSFKQLNYFCPPWKRHFDFHVDISKRWHQYDSYLCKQVSKNASLLKEEAFHVYFRRERKLFNFPQELSQNWSNKNITTPTNTIDRFISLFILKCKWALMLLPPLYGINRE